MAYLDPVELADARALAASGAARRIRIASRLSLSEVAVEVGATPAAVQKWETAAMLPKGERAIRYGRLLRRLMAGPQ
jgi:DNA-binding transcriptional regulator YiaG